MKIDCPWKGCNGVIDLTKEFADWPHRGRTAFLIHAIMCPKCHNSVGTMELAADVWFNPKTKKRSINDPETGREIVIRRRSELRKFLKDWAKGESHSKTG